MDIVNGWIMQDQDLKIILNPQNLQGAVLLRHTDCKSSIERIEKPIQLLDQKYLAMKKSGQISSYRMDRARLENAWKIIGSPDFVWKDREFLVDFSQGFPTFFGVVVQPPKDAQAIASISLRPSEKQEKKWSLSWLKKYIELKISEFGSENSVSEGQIAYALFKSLRGETVQNMQLYPIKDLQKDAAAIELDIFSYPNSMALYLAIRDPMSILNAMNISEIIKILKARIDLYADKNQLTYILLESAISESLREKSLSLSVIGIDPPLNLLVAIPEKEELIPIKRVEQASDATDAKTKIKSKELIYNGSVTRNMGPMHFDSDVVIKGSIESGASVTAAGNMHVIGEIKGAQVRCYGNLVVDGGITMGDQGKVHVSGNMKSAFLELAKVVCAGYMEINKSILNSYVYVGHNLVVYGADSLVTGGEISCRGSLRVANLGLRLGKKTILRLGVDWRAEHRLACLQMRTSLVEAYMQQTRNTLRDLVSQKLKRNDEEEQRKLSLQNTLQRCRTVLDKISAMKFSVKTLYTYHQQSQAVITGRVDQNCDVFICDKPVGLTRVEAGIIIKTSDRGQPIIAAA